mgnify:CR=1 FL=1
MIQSHSRSNLSVGARFAIYHLAFTIVIAVVLYGIFGVIGWSGILDYFKGDVIFSAGFVITIIAGIIVVSLWGMGWAAKKGVGK